MTAGWWIAFGPRPLVVALALLALAWWPLVSSDPFSPIAGPTGPGAEALVEAGFAFAVAACALARVGIGRLDETLARRGGLDRLAVELAVFAAAAVGIQLAVVLPAVGSGLEAVDWARLGAADLQLVALAAILRRVPLAPEAGAMLWLLAVWIVPAGLTSVPVARGLAGLDPALALRSDARFPLHVLPATAALLLATYLLTPSSRRPE